MYDLQTLALLEWNNLTYSLYGNPNLTCSCEAAPQFTPKYFLIDNRTTTYFLNLTPETHPDLPSLNKTSFLGVSVKRVVT